MANTIGKNANELALLKEGKTMNGNCYDFYPKEERKWYNKLHTDSAEYKMWGNGIALPNALYVMEGIAECLEEKG